MKRVWLLERGYQLRFWLRFCGLTIGGFAAFALLLYLTTGRDLGRSYGEAMYTISALRINIFSLMLASVYSMVIMVLTVVFIALVSIFFSHRMAGPVFRFARDFEPLARGDLRGETRFRDGDQYAQVAREKNNMTARLRAIVVGTRSDIGEIREASARLCGMCSRDDDDEVIREALKDLDVLVSKMRKRIFEIKTSR